MFVKQIIFILTISIITCQCSVPPPSYTIPTPLNLTCSTNYDPNNPHDPLTIWSSNCNGLTLNKVWIRFFFYSNAPDFSGWNIYFDPSKSTNWNKFKKYVDQHIVNDVITTSPHIIPNTDGSTFNFNPNLPTIAVKSGISWNFPSGDTIQGLNNYTSELTAIIIPPIQDLIKYKGSIAVTANDYINKTESLPSNIIIIER